MEFSFLWDSSILTGNNEHGDTLEIMCEVICRDQDGADAETNVVTIWNDTQERVMEFEELDPTELAKIELNALKLGGEKAYEAYCEYSNSYIDSLDLER